MESIALSGLQLFAALLLVALNGLFVAAEFAFVKIRSSKVGSSSTTHSKIKLSESGFRERIALATRGVGVTKYS